MNALLTKIQKMGIVSLISLENEDDAIPVAKALMTGGLYCIEVTFRTTAAKSSIKQIAEKFPEIIIGAGTVLTKEQVDEAIEAGAQFIVTPGLNPVIVEYCKEKGVPIVPGCATATEVDKAIELGLEIVKFFPAEAAGGIEVVKAISGPYGKMKYMATGGINLDNLTKYLDFKKMLACGGSWMINKQWIKDKNFAEITKAAQESINVMLGFKVKHIGINTKNEKEADGVANSFSSIFGFEKKVGNSSIFVSDGIEVMKEPYLGANGHIAVETRDIERAIFFLEQKGYKCDKKTAKYDKNENMVAIYLENEIGGFAIHLLQKK